MQQDINNFLLFIGYPRSGHTIVANIVNTHKNILVSDEVGIMKHNIIQKNKIIKSIIKRSKEVDIRYTSVYKNVDYQKEEIKKEKIILIGDKHANKNTIFINKNFNKLISLQNIFDVKLLHIIRNPYDMITTNFLRRGKKWDNNLYNIIDHFDILFSTVQKIKKYYNVIDIYLEDLIYYPINNICYLFEELKFPIEDNIFLNRLTGKLIEKPNESRHLIEWKEDQVKLVENMFNKYEFLNIYKKYV